MNRNIEVIDMVENKVWYKSKGKIGAILVALGCVGGYLTGSTDIVTAATGVFAALAVFGIRDAL